MRQKILEISESRLITRIMPIIFLVLISLVFTAGTEGRFIEARNLRLILEQALITGTVASGAVFIFATGNVNIAMGATSALAATLSALIYQATGSLPLMLVSALLIGVGLMVASALLSTWLGVRVMFVTIVMMILLAAIQSAIIGGSTIMLPFEMTTMLKDRYIPYFLFGGFAILCAILFEFTALGRKLKFIGTNEACAEQSGIKNSIMLLVSFAIAGIGVASAAVMLIIRTSSISTSTAISLNMDVILALVLGGMSIFGGSRSFIYAGIIGAITVTTLNNGLLMLGVSSTILQGIRGIIFLILVFSSQKRPQGLPERGI